MNIKDLLASLKNSTTFSGSLRNDAVVETVSGNTGTGLDRLVTLITEDSELNRRISASDINEAAESANGMNAIIIEAIKATERAEPCPLAKATPRRGSLGLPRLFQMRTQLRMLSTALR